MTNFTILGWITLAGLASGFVFQRSRLCFVSALRDLYLFRALGMTRAMLLLFLITVAGGALLSPVRGALSPAGLAGPSPEGALVGGAIFAMGMVLAGSCAAGAFWRFGEGQFSQLYILLGLAIGTWVYAKLPLFPVTRLQPTFSAWLAVALLALGYLLLIGWERLQAHMGEEIQPETRRFAFRAPWPAEIGALVMAVLLVAFMALTGETWRVTRAFLFSDYSALTYALGLAGGGFLGARFGHEWRRRPAGTWSQAAIRLAGGVLMGYGARVGWGCTVGAVLSGMVSLSVQPWYWLAGAILGAAGGAAILRRYMNFYL